VVNANETGADTVDDVIVKVASKGECAVFTNDRQLKKKLRDINVPVIYVRQKSRLGIDGRP
ncbi:nucleotide-binding protein, partial [Candidatus Bathyarchaeota archaeon]|nr:nucleotide-binding protein [Candidatus Bathyarchaeota archaeon]